MPKLRTTPIEQAVTAVDEHLTGYGHKMTWQEGGARADGACGRCQGRVIVCLGAQGVPCATADPAMIAPRTGDGGDDYAECPSIPRTSRFRCPRG